MRNFVSLRTVGAILSALYMLGEPYASASDIIIKRQVLSKSTIKLDGDREGGNCIVDHSQNDDSQVGFGDCMDSASVWQFKGTTDDFDGYHAYWVGKIMNADRSLCLTIASTADQSTGTDEFISIPNRNSYKIITSVCKEEDSVRQTWYVNSFSDGARLNPANQTGSINCDWPGVPVPFADSGLLFAVTSTNDNPDMIVGICRGVGKETTGWVMKIDDKDYGPL